MKNILILLILFLSVVGHSQEYPGFITGRCDIAQSGSGLGYWQVNVTNYSNPRGLDAGEIQSGDLLHFTDASYNFFLPITAVISASGTNAVIRVNNTGVTQVASVPTTTGFITRGSPNLKLFPYVANITDNDNQIFQEYNMYLIDSLLSRVTTGNGKCLETTVYVPGHSFTIGDPVLFDSGNLIDASVNSLLPAQAVVIENIDVDTVKIAYSGQCVATSHGLTIDSAYYTNRVSGPVIDGLKPDTTQFLFKPLDANTLIVAIANMYLGGALDGIIDSTRIIQDSIIVYYQNGTTIGRDTLFSTKSNGYKTLFNQTHLQNYLSSKHDDGRFAYFTQGLGTGVPNIEIVGGSKISGNYRNTYYLGMSADNALKESNIILEGQRYGAGGNSSYTGLQIFDDSTTVTSSQYYKPYGSFSQIYSSLGKKGTNPDQYAVGVSGGFGDPSYKIFEIDFNNIADSTGNKIQFYNKYRFKNAAMSAVAGDTTIMAWAGGNTPLFLDKSDFGAGGGGGTDSTFLKNNLTQYNAVTHTLVDNNAAAIRLDAAGKPLILRVITSNGNEGISTSGSMGVTEKLELGGQGYLGNSKTDTMAIRGTLVLRDSAETLAGAYIGLKAEEVSTPYTIVLPGEQGTTGKSMSISSVSGNTLNMGWETGGNGIYSGSDSLSQEITYAKMSSGLGSNFGAGSEQEFYLGYFDDPATNQVYGDSAVGFYVSQYNTGGIGLINNMPAVGGSHIDMQPGALYYYSWAPNYTHNSTLYMYSSNANARAGSFVNSGSLQLNKNNRTSYVSDFSLENYNTVGLAHASLVKYGYNRIAGVGDVSVADTSGTKIALKRLTYDKGYGTVVDTIQALEFGKTKSSFEFGSDGTINDFNIINNDNHEGFRLTRDILDVTKNIVSRYTFFDVETGSTTGNYIKLYNNQYQLPNATPSAVAGDTSMIAWAGGSPFFMKKTEFKEDGLSAEVAINSVAVKFSILPVNCSGGTITITPPSTPVAGDWFAISDSRANAAVNNITIDVSGNKLHGAAVDYIMNTNADFVKLTYVNATIGWVKTN